MLLSVHLYYKNRLTYYYILNFVKNCGNLFSLIVYCLHNVFISVSWSAKPKMFNILPVTEILADFVPVDFLIPGLDYLRFSLFIWTEVCLEGGSLPKSKLKIFPEAGNLCRQIKMDTTAHLISNCPQCT